MAHALASAAFFAAVRPMFGGKLSQSQVDGINAIMDGWSRHGRDPRDDKKLAYVLATAYHETARTMQPVRETLATSDASAKQRLTKAWKAGKLGSVKKDYWSGGYFGRGYVQLTHEANYRRAGAELGIDLVSDPSLALDPNIAAAILVRGMREGWFTGKKLEDYVDGTKTDYVNARRVVNGTDKARLIADVAETFEAALRAARHAQNEVETDDLLRSVEEALRTPAEPLPEATPTPPEPETPASEPLPLNLWKIGALVLGVVALAMLGLNLFS